MPQALRCVARGRRGKGLGGGCGVAGTRGIAAVVVSRGQVGNDINGRYM